MATILVCCFGSGIALNRARGSSALDTDKSRPVSKVITLLKEMLMQLEKEAAEDEEIFDKMACWCTTNDKEKTKAIADAEARIADLTTKIEKDTALSAQLNTEIKNLEKEVAASQAALDTAAALREKQLADFNAEEKDSLESVSALKSAVIVLGKHQGASLLEVARTLRRAFPRAEASLTHDQRRVATSFLQAVPGESYSPQSSEIFGVLSQMKETFEENLAVSQKEEQENSKAFEDLKIAKEAEIKAGQEQIDAKTQTLAETDEKNAQAKEDIVDTKESLSADEEFLAMLKEKCSMTDSEWEERQKTRQLEMEAVSKALAVLSGDDAHDLFSKTFNPGFVQTGSTSRREAAARVLESVARKLGGSQLLTLASQVRLDAFECVKKAIADMITELGNEKADEIKHKDFCVDEFNTNKMQTETKEREKSLATASLEDMSMTVKSLTEALDALKAEVAEMNVQMKRAGEDRENQNKEFQAIVSDQRATEKLLKAALVVLEGFYSKKEATAFAQQAPAGSPPPGGFKSYAKNGSSGGVMALLQQIIDDAKAMESEAIRSEEDAQKGYEDFVKETNASIDAKSKEMVNKSEEKAKTEARLVEEKKTLESVMTELEGLANYNAELHQSCDFILKNFDIRQQARDEEVEALKQANAILSGANFD